MISSRVGSKHTMTMAMAEPIRFHITTSSSRPGLQVRNRLKTHLCCPRPPPPPTQPFLYDPRREKGKSNHFVTFSTGTFTALFTNPIWVIKTRMLSTSSSYPGAYTSISDGVRQIFRSEGLRGFYKGLVPSLFGVSHGALQFMAYEKLKISRRRVGGVGVGVGGTAQQQQQRDLRTFDFLLLSGLAKIFAAVLSYPYQVIRTRLQIYDDTAKAYKGSRDVVTQIWRHEGIKGFYKGLAPNLLRVMPSTWVTFLVYEKTRLHLPGLLGKFG